jgi:hypothetical protein
MTPPPHIRWGGEKTREDRGLVTSVWASMRRRRPHSTIRGFAVPPAHSGTNMLVRATHSKRGGWGAQRRAKKVGREGDHGLSRAEVEIRLVRDERGVQGGAGLPV